MSEATFDPKGLVVVTAGYDGVAKRWQVPPTDLSVGELALEPGDLGIRSRLREIERQLRGDTEK